eukprot:COSAG02_NODE_71229_length_191_cov_2352.065217_1_plen_47_part_10
MLSRVLHRHARGTDSISLLRAWGCFELVCSASYARTALVTVKEVSLH